MIVRRLVTINELKMLMEVFSIAFQSEYKTIDSYLKEMVEKNSCVILGAITDQKIVGGIVAFEINPIHGKKEIYIYDIAVHPDYRQKGVGKKLIEYLKGEAKTKGVKNVFVEAESEDTDAILFYRKIGGEEVAVNHFNFSII